MLRACDKQTQDVSVVNLSRLTEVRLCCVMTPQTLHVQIKFEINRPYKNNIMRCATIVGGYVLH